MRVIGTVGLAGSGKGEFATVAEELGVPAVTMGDVIRQACRDRGLDPAEHHGAVAQALREENGPTAIAEASLPHVEAAPMYSSPRARRTKSARTAGTGPDPRPRC